MSHEWALLKNGQIVNVVTTTACKRDIQKRYPTHEVAWLYGLPAEVRWAYRYWDERPGVTDQ
jgi:hypothetical protein